MEEACKILAQEIEEGKIKSRDELNKRKVEVARKYNLKKIISNSDIYKFLKLHPQKKIFLPLLQKKPTRTISGVSVVAVMSRPNPCPHGRCTYCPGGGNVPQSYTGHEPATMRGIQHNFDSKRQVEARLKQLQSIGHSTDKVEVIVMGGTFLNDDKEYQDSFVKGIFDGLNGKISSSIKMAQKMNEMAKNKCVGLTFETRPDWCKKPHICRMLEYGATRVELGVQNIYDDVYERVRRGHRVSDVVEATQLLKDSGLKVCYHLMPGLPGTDFERDLKGFRKVFEDSKFKPDMVKFYPLIVLENTPIFKTWKKKEYKPYDLEEVLELLIEVKKFLPKWCRVMRIQRDIPSKLIVAGVKKTNLAQILEGKMKKRGVECQCIRCREVGRGMLRGKKPFEKSIKLLRENYKASDGEEIFLSFEDTKNNLIIGFLRLRIPNNPFRKEITEKTSLVRELHVYGKMVEIGEKPVDEWQHKTFGEKLLKEAERISVEEFEMKKILVTSGVGAREYYRRFGYKRQGPYMGKLL